MEKKKNDRAHGLVSETRGQPIAFKGQFCAGASAGVGASQSPWSQSKSPFFGSDPLNPRSHGVQAVQAVEMPEAAAAHPCQVNSGFKHRLPRMRRGRSAVGARRNRPFRAIMISSPRAARCTSSERRDFASDRGKPQGATHRGQPNLFLSARELVVSVAFEKSAPRSVVVPSVCRP